MSQLRAPAERPDRREGRRHGRSGTRSLPNHGRSAAPSPPARIRPQLLRVAVLPAAVVAIGGAAAVAFTIRSAGVQPSPTLWATLTGAAAVAVAAVAAAVLGADRAAQSVLDRSNALRRVSVRRQNELRAVVEQLRRGERLPLREGVPAVPSSGGDEFDLLTEELARSHEVAVATAVQASRLSSSVGNEQKVEVFVNLARRLQSLVHREIQLLDELENQVEDPELLKGLFHVDHLATRIRRHAENLAVLGGAVSRRQWSNPVTMTEVLRSSIAEVEHYPRVKLVPPIDGTLRGHAVADVIHLLAELVENATLFSAPNTAVLLRAQHCTAGLAVEVEDRGLGMPVSEQNRMNALLADPDQVNVARMLQDGRIGLFVVSALARRHGIAVRLQSNIYGGVQAVLVLPQELLGDEPAAIAQSDEDGQAVRQHLETADEQPRPAVHQGHPGPHDERALAGTAPAAVPPPARVRAEGAVPGPATHRPPGPATDQPGPGIPPPPAQGPSTPPAPGGPAAAPLPVRGQQHRPNPADAAPGPYVPRYAGRADGPDRPAPTVHSNHADRTDPGGRTDRPDLLRHAGHPDPTGHLDRPDRTAHADYMDHRGPGDHRDPAEPADHRDPAMGGDPEARPATAGRPRLPKRRAQEHLVPQLRDAPAPRRDDDHLVLHDPGLMAAFQRGIGLAESMPATTPVPGHFEPHRQDEAHKE
ncbi:ATP-binding protein [Streptomyces sp. NPDC050856]|uniref:ATP-binding protein n=1 Tax=Streptomyces sp. NPDC050856 TaxID=3154939 RepID=UPI0033C23928